MRPPQSFPQKNPGGTTVPEDPSACFPLTRGNMRTNLSELLRQFLTYDATRLQAYKCVVHQLYTADARFQYPLAEMNDRDAVTAFWVFFLLGRAVQLLDVYGLHIDCVWDEEKLQAVVQIEAWQHHRPLAWLEKLLRVPQWKVYTSQVFQFVDYPADGQGALRVHFQEELSDQFVFFGIIPCGLYSLRSDPDTPLNLIRTAIRRCNSLSMYLAALMMEELVKAMGLGDSAKVVAHSTDS